jgi:ABC-type amino acid transport substrate-binding protein
MNLFKKHRYLQSSSSMAPITVPAVGDQPQPSGPQKVVTSSGDGSAKFKDFLFPLLLVLVAMLTISLYVASGYHREVISARRNVIELNEEDATLEQRIEVAERIKRLNALDDAAPHPKEAVKDQSFIGQHVNVGWDYKAGEVNKNFGYEIELYRNRLNGSPPIGCPLSETAPTPETFWKGCQGPIYFVATDPNSMTSRIPADVEETLSPGMYSWRVAPVGINSRLRSADPLQWSSFGSFTVDRSILERIRRTNHIRVGTNFAQDSPFSRLGNEGQELGFDIELIRTLVEGCTQLDKGAIVYRAPDCGRYLSTVPRPKPSCNGNHLCVQFVPIGTWGDWKSRLSSKDIDLFVGGITRADSREGKGILFTNGYLTYRSKLYKRPERVNERTTIAAWTRIPRKVGVIANSTNEEFLDRLIASGNFPDLSKSGSISSFPELEHALDSGEVDGIIIDDTFVPQDDNWVAVEIPKDSTAWKSYLNKFIRISNNSQTPAREQIAIATVWDAPQSDNSLLTALNQALNSPALRKYLSSLCRSTWNNSRSDVCNLSFPAIETGKQ